MNSLALTNHNVRLLTTAKAEERFMIDYGIYRRLYPDKSMFRDRTDDLGPEAMDAAEPPDEDFLVMMPPVIHGFDLANKSWSMLILTDVLMNITLEASLTVSNG